MPNLCSSLHKYLFCFNGTAREQLIGWLHRIPVKDCELSNVELSTSPNRTVSQAPKIVLQEHMPIKLEFSLAACECARRNSSRCGPMVA